VVFSKLSRTYANYYFSSFLLTRFLEFFRGKKNRELETRLHLINIIKSKKREEYMYVCTYIYSVYMEVISPYFIFTYTIN